MFVWMKSAKAPEIAHLIGNSILDRTHCFPKFCIHIQSLQWLSNQVGIYFFPHRPAAT